MAMHIPPARCLLIVLFLLGGGSLFAAPDTETLHYKASYRGVFSAGSEVTIADVVLRTRDPAEGAVYLESELSASSEAYGYVESIYPIRYRFRSWYWRDRSGVLASEYFEYGRPDDIEHRLIHLDSPGKPFVTRRLGDDKVLDLHALREGTYLPTAVPGERQTFDRLGLLQHIRWADLVPGKVLELAVSNGSKMLRYRVKVEAADPLKVAGQEWPALKLRFDGLTQDRHGNEKHTHRPVFIWVSVDERHIPLRAESKHVLGRFRVELQPGPTLSRVALGTDD